MSVSILSVPNKYDLFCNKLTCNECEIITTDFNSIKIGDGLDDNQTLITIDKGVPNTSYLNFKKDFGGNVGNNAVLFHNPYKLVAGAYSKDFTQTITYSTDPNSVAIYGVGKVMDIDDSSTAVALITVMEGSYPAGSVSQVFTSGNGAVFQNVIGCNFTTVATLDNITVSNSAIDTNIEGKNINIESINDSISLTAKESSSFIIAGNNGGSANLSLVATNSGGSAGIILSSTDNINLTSTNIAVTGTLFVNNGLKDSTGALGTASQVLTSNGTATLWANQAGNMNIYNSDGVVTSNRTLDGNSNSISLTFKDFDIINFDNNAGMTVTNGEFSPDSLLPGRIVKQNTATGTLTGGITVTGVGATITVQGNSVGGRVLITTGTGISATGIIATIVFPFAMNSTNQYGIILSPNNSATTLINDTIWAQTGTITQFTMRNNANLTDSTSYVWSYILLA